MTQENQKRKPDFNIFPIVQDGDSTRIGRQIGVAFKHEGKSGFNLILETQPFPIDGKIQLVAFSPNEKE